MSDSETVYNPNNEFTLICTPDINIDCENEPDYSSESDSRESKTVQDNAPKLAGLMPSSQSKRKHKVLSLETKIELLRRLDAGESFNSLAAHYNVGRATIFDIKNRKDSILEFASKFEKNGEELKNRKTVRKHTRAKTNPSSAPIKPLYDDGFVSSRRRHNVLSIERKIEIIQRLERGESGASLAPLYNVGRATISDIKSKKDSILMFASKLNSEEGLKKRKTMRHGNDKPLEDAIYKWYVQKLSRGETVSGPALCRKALEINTMLGGPKDFKASTGWLKNFKSRHGLKHLQLEQDTFTGNASDADTFLQSYLALLEQEGYSMDDIYCADETVINWKTLPKNSLPYERLKEESNSDRITIMVCANICWNHSLPLLMIGRTNKTKCFKGVACLPVIYMPEKNGWMDSELFIDWYSNHFIPTVQKERELSGKFGNVMLLLDKATYHPSADMLNKVNDNFRVTFIPQNVTSLVHPMNQNILKKFKRIFRKQILCRLLLAKRDEDSVVELANRLTLKECSYMLADVWDAISEENKNKMLQKQECWSSISAESSTNQSDLKELEEFQEMFNALPGFSQCSVLDAAEWLKSDEVDPGHRILNEDEIVTAVKQEDIDEYSDDDETDTFDFQDIQIAPTHSEAFTAFETAIKWCEQQQECSPDKLLLLKRLKDLSAKKSLTAWNACNSDEY